MFVVWWNIEGFLLRLGQGQSLPLSEVVEVDHITDE